jgi:hypothetical protein
MALSIAADDATVVVMTASPSERLDALEVKVDVLIGRVDAIDQRLTDFQTETRLEFAAVRTEATAIEGRLQGEIGASETRLRGEIRDSETRLRSEIRDSETRLRSEISASEDRLRGEVRESEERLRGEMRSTNEETRRHRLVLHEELLTRLRTIGEGAP